MIENEMTVSVPLEVVKASEIEPKEVKWLWYPYIPFGKVTLLQGDPGDGKSKLMLSVAALLSKGEPLPFTETEENEPMTIIYQTTEDDADDTVVPRFNSAGGNGENLIFIREDEKSLSFGDNRIREAIEMYHAKLLILDPMSSYIGEICSMNNANETRAEFNHLIAVAKDTGCAIVIIAHMNKMKDTNPLYRTNGSIDIAGAARSILAITRTPNKEVPAERYLVQVKSNLAPTGSAILFEVSEKGVDFISEMEMTAEEVVHQISHSKKWKSDIPLTDEKGNPLLRKNGKPMFRASYSILQDELFNHMTEQGFKGFQRGEYGSTAEHLTSLQYQIKQDKERLEQLQKRIQHEQIKYEPARNVSKTYNEIDRMGQKTITGKMAISKEDYSQLTALAKEGITSRAEIKKFEQSATYYRQKYMDSANALERMKTKYNELKEKCRPFLEALEHFPEVAKLLY